MQRLVEGIHQFQLRVLAEKQALFRDLEQGQHPQALFITCSDSRIVPNLLTQTEPGELFILRTAGNIVPSYGSVKGGEAATIEYAVSALKVQDIIVCGHSHCGAMAALLNPESVHELPAVRELLAHAGEVRELIAEDYTDDGARLTATIEQNVLVQLEHLRTHPSVTAALAAGQVRLHGWVYRFETGEVFAHDAACGTFQPIDSQLSDPASSASR